jgi:hypothetical protein
MNSKNLSDGLSDVGKVSATIGLIFASIFSILLFIVSIYLLLNDSSDEYDKVVGIVVDSVCNTTNNTCSITAQYNYNNINYEKNILAPFKQYTKNQNINLKISKNNIDDVSLDEKSNRVWLYVMLIMSILIFIIAVLNYYFVNKNKAYASVQGASTIWGVVS